MDEPELHLPSLDPRGSDATRELCPPFGHCVRRLPIASVAWQLAVLSCAPEIGEKQFPAPSEENGTAMTHLNLVFAFIFTLEAGIKVYTLRSLKAVQSRAPGVIIRVVVDDVSGQAFGRPALVVKKIVAFLKAFAAEFEGRLRLMPPSAIRSSPNC